MPQPKDKDWVNGYKNKTSIYPVYKRPTSNQRKVKGQKKIFHANRDQKKAGIAKLISDKIDFKTKAVKKKNKEGHYIMIKGSIQEEDITIINIYAPNIRALQYDNHDGVITHLEPDILECEVKGALESITANKASGDDGAISNPKR